MKNTATKTASQIINALSFLTKEQKQYILTNKISHLPMGLELTEDKHKFISITNFNHIEQIEILKEDFRIWEHFTMLNDLKTALNCMTSIAEGRKFTIKFFENQKNITSKKEITATGFMDFLNGLTPEEKTHLKAEILRWDAENLMQNLTSYLESYQLNDGNKFKTGDYIIYFDQLQNASFYGRIFQAEKNGLIFINTGEGSFILDNRMTLETIPAEKIPTHFKKPIDKFFIDYSEAGEEFRNKFFDKLEKETARKEKAAEKLALEHEKKFTAEILKASKIGFLPAGDGKNKDKYLYDGKYHSIEQLKKIFLTILTLTDLQADFIRTRDEATATAYAELIKTELTSPAEIEEFLKTANQYNWSKKQKESINGMIKIAKEKIKEALKNKQIAEKPAESESTAEKPAKTAILAKTTAKTRRKKPATKPEEKTEDKPAEGTTETPQA